jgi:hemolysin activation/secretion protein
MQKMKHIQTQLIYKLLLFFIAFCFLFNIPVYSLTSDEKRIIDEQRLMQQKNQIDEEKRRLLRQQDEIEKLRNRKIFKPEIKPEIVSKIQKETIYVNEIKVEGITVFSPHKISSITSKYINRELSKTDIGNFQINLQNLYMSKGYIASRVYFDFKELPSGILKIVFLEGTISNIYFSNPKDSNFPILTAFPFLKNNVFNIRDIEQGLEQLNRLPSNDAVMNIKPAEKEGETAVEITNKHTKRIRLNFGLDNSGSKSTSEYRANTAFSLDNLLRVNDSLNFNYSQGLEDDETKGFYSKSYSGSISLPFGYWTVNGSYSQSLYLSTVQGLNGKISSKGDSENRSIGFERMLFRGQRYKLISGANLNLKDSNNFVKYGLINQKSETGSRRLVPAEIYLTNTIYLNKGTLFVKANYNRGLDNFDAKKDALNLEKGQPRAQYESLCINGYFSDRFNFPKTKFPISYMMNFKSQYSWNDLFGSEQFGASIRGFKDGGVSGESGYSSTNDFKTQFLNLLPFFRNKLVNNILKNSYIGLFYDIGSITPQTYGRTEIMSGWGVTLSGNFLKYINLNVSLANTIDVPKDVNAGTNVISASINVNIPIL